MADPYPIRPVTDDEYGAFRRVHDHAFNSGPARAADWPRMTRQFEADRSLAAFDPALAPGDGLVGATGVYSLRLSVPGAVLPVAGITAVAVLPTYRRRGILRSLMRRQLTDIATRGQECVAALWASETPLYGRYGYGRASSHAFFRFGRGEGALGPAGCDDPALALRLADPRACAAELAGIYDTVRPGQPGFYARDADWWDRVMHDPEDERNGFGPLLAMIATGGPGDDRGYALYRTAARWERGTFLADGALVVHELIAADPAAGAALWRDLLSRDLITEVTADLRPVDDPVLYQLLDARRARPQVADGLWVRIIDLPAALTHRDYACPADVVIEVTDDLLPGNAGRWRLTAAGPGGGSTCGATSEPADLRLDVRELGAAYLGGTRLGALAAAGLVSEARPGAVRQLSAAMSWDPAPWCPHIF